MHLGQLLIALVVGPWANWPAMSYQRVSYRKRLSVVQSHFSTCLDEAPSGRLGVVSLCAGDGRDVIGVLESHTRRDEVDAVLVELDRESVLAGMEQRAAAGLNERVTFINGDATDFATYQNCLPCDVVLLCGVLGHVRPDERLQLVQSLAAFCKPGATLLWTRRVDKGMTRFTNFQELLELNSFERVQESFTDDGNWGVCTHRYVGLPRTIQKSGRIFQFERKAGRN